MKNNNIGELQTELRSILETEGALTDEQVARVDEIESGIENLERLERDTQARSKAEARLSTASFSKPTAAETRSDVERFADWAITGADYRAEVPGSHAITGGATDALQDGGYLVPLDLQSELVKKLNGLPGIRNAVDVRNYGFNVEIARVASRPSIVAFTGEGATYDPIDVDFDKVRSYSFKSAAESYITEELMQDARPQLIAEILESHVASHQLFWDDQYATAGVGGANGPEAIFDDGVSGINTATTSAIDTITIDDLYDTYLGVLPAQYRNGSYSWVMHPTVEAELRTERDTTGRFSLLGQANGTDATLPGSTIAGIPVVISTNAPTMTAATAGSAPAVMLMERSSYRIFDRMPMLTQRDEFSKGSTGEVVFRSKLRSDGRWLAPWTSVAINLKQS